MSENWLNRYGDEFASVAEGIPEENPPAEIPLKDKSPAELVEKAQQRYEQNVEASKDQRWPDRPDWAEDEAARKINPMHYLDFIAKCHSVGCYVAPNDFSRLGRIGINGVSKGIFRTITTLQWPMSYEYTVMRFNEYRVPTNEKYRGYRTAILHLIAAGVMTKEQALRAFGPPQGPAADTYLRELALL